MSNKFLKIFLVIVTFAIISLSTGKFFGHEIYKDADNDFKVSGIELEPDGNKGFEEVSNYFQEINSNYSFHTLDSLSGAYSLYDKNKDLLCKILLSSPYCDSIIGYAGVVPFAIVIDKSAKISKIHLLPHSETPAWIKRLNKKKFFEKWDGLSLEEAQQKQVDAVSGATYTSEAVIESMDIRLNSYFSAQKLINNSKKKSDVLKLVLSLLFVIFAILSFMFRKIFAKFRTVLLISSIGILGFWAGDFLSIAILRNWFINGISLKNQIFIFSVFILSILLPIITNRSFYCQYVCPYGNAQELLGKITRKKIKIPPRLVKILKNFRFILLFILAVFIVASLNISLENFEPFSAFKFEFASLAVIILAISFLLLSIISNKPWCKFFCPTGAFLSLFRHNKNSKNQIKISPYIIINITLSLILLFLIFSRLHQNSDKTESIITNPKSLNMETNKTIETILNRKSVRDYTDQKISESQIDTLLRAGMAAPSGRNLQPWAFIVVTEKTIIDKLADSLPHAKMLYKSSLAILVCGDMQKAGDKTEYWDQDCSAATQNMLLAAESMGFGAVWTAVYPSEEKISLISKILELPSYITPLNVIAFGYPNGEQKIKDKWNPENIHWNKFNEK